MAQYKLKLFPINKTIEVDGNTNLLEAMKKAGLHIKSSCGGYASCGDCVVKIREGVDHLGPQEFKELNLLGNIFHITKERLSCQTKISGDVEIDISHHLDQMPQEISKPQKVVRRTKDELEAKEKNREPQGPREPKQSGFRKPKPFKS